MEIPENILRASVAEIIMRLTDSQLTIKELDYYLDQYFIGLHELMREYCNKEGRDLPAFKITDTPYPS